MKTKQLVLFALIFAFMFVFSAGLFAQIDFGTWSKENDTWRASTTTTQLTTASGKDTTEVFQLQDIDNDIRTKNVSNVYLNCWFRSADADSANIGLTLQGGYDNDWNGSLWTTVDGKDSGTTANNGVNEIQFVITTSDLAYPHWRILYECAAGHTLETNTTTLYWFVTVDYDK